MTGKEYIISELEKIEKGEKSKMFKYKCVDDFGLKRAIICADVDCRECWKQALESEIE